MPLVIANSEASSNRLQSTLLRHGGLIGIDSREKTRTSRRVCP